MRVLNEKNGEMSIAEAIDATEIERFSSIPAVLTPVALRRLARLGAAVEGATDVAQAAINAHSTRKAAYQQAFEAACEDVGLQIPSGPHDIGIDWATGVVTFIPQQS